MSYPDPRYLGGPGEVSARFRGAATPPDLPLGGGGACHYLATGASTNGQFGLYRWDMGPAAGGPATHFHRTISESFFILSGEVRLFDGRAWKTAGAGDFLFVPEGGLHAFRNDSDEPASMLLLFAPGAPREGYFEGIRTLQQLSEPERAGFFIRHDTYWADPG
ncbi:MAG: cupin domain-containing protein [Acidimicrobiales bacterium]